MSEIDPVVAFADAVLGPSWRLKAQIRSTLFDKQLAVYDDPAQFKECHAGRRGAKSDGIPKSVAMDALDAGPNEVVLLVAETLKKAKQLHWGNLNAVVVKHQLPFTPNSSDGSWTTPNGARVIFWGLNDSGAVELLRGFKVFSARVDECATIASMLPDLVTRVLEPALGDTGGSLTLYGTPSVTRAGAWFDVCEGSEASKWSHHHWDVRSNPYFRPARGGGAKWLDEVLARNGWDWSHPTFKCEYLGLFVDDSNRLVVRFDRQRDTVDALPPHYDASWRTIAGVDYGYNDAVAVVVIAADPYGAKYLVHTEKASQLTYDQAADMLRRILTQHNCTQVACDPAGGGKAFYESFNRKYGNELGVNMVAAHRVAGSVVESIRFQNTELSSQRLKLVTPACEPLIREWQVLPWGDDLRTKTMDSFPQDLFDACRYALMETLPWRSKPMPKVETETERMARLIREGDAVERRLAEHNPQPNTPFQKLWKRF